MLRLRTRDALALTYAALLAACTPAAQRSERPDAAVAPVAQVAPVAPIAATKPPEIAPAERARILEAIAKEVAQHYVDPDVGAQMASDLGARAASGAYDGIESAAELARVVTDDMRRVSHDPHAMLERAPDPAAASADDAREARLDAENRATAGVGSITRVSGNVAVLVMRSFPPLDEARDVLARRLTEVADASALVVDLRENGGGDPETVAFVASYLFDGSPVHLNDMWWRDSGWTQRFFTHPDVPGKRFGGKKPVFVLIGPHTFSAAEELAYDLQAQKRAVVVGEPSRGGAHPVNPIPISPRLTVRVPTGRAINPVTGTDWEGKGVQPDVAVPVDASLERAVKLATAPRDVRRHS